MSNNPYVNKVVSNNITLIDLTADTVTPADVRSGVTFHDLTGAAQVGTMVNGKVVASVAPASVPVAWNITVTAIMERCNYSAGQHKSATVEFEISNTPYKNLSDYGISYVYAGGPSLNIIDANGDTHSSTTWTDTTSALTEIDDNTTPVGYSVVEIDGTTYGRIQPSSSENYGYIELDDGEYVTSLEVTAFTLEPDSQSLYHQTIAYETNLGNTGTVETKSQYGAYANWNKVTIDSVTIDSVSAYAPGYLVTYTDNTSETFVAAAADVADGGSY